MYQTEQIIHFLTTPPPYPFYQWFIIIRNIFLVASLFFLVCIIYFLFKSSWLRYRYAEDAVEFFTYHPLVARKFTKKWNKIKIRLKSGQEEERKLAVIEADSMFNDMLKKMGFNEPTFEARIKNLVSNLMPNIESVLEAHKVRNNIVHDPNYQLNLDEAKKILLIYEKALTDLQIL